MTSTYHTRTESGEWFAQAIPHRGRHYWGERIEIGTRALTHDAQPHPFTNWGFSNRLDWTLAKLREARKDAA